MSIDIQTPFKLYSVREVAEMLGVSETTVRMLHYSGKLKTYKVGRSLRISHDSVTAYLNGQGAN